MNTPHKTDASPTDGYGAEYERLNALPLWRTMPAVTLDQMKGIRLMNRIDTKYVLPQRLLAPLLEQAAMNGYRIQQIDGARACRYDTLYYDTPSREMYRLHHDRRLVRQKIRTRTYVESGSTFLEIKNKTNKGRTRKTTRGIRTIHGRCGGLSILPRAMRISPGGSVPVALDALSAHDAGRCRHERKSDHRHRPEVRESSQRPSRIDRGNGNRRVEAGCYEMLRHRRHNVPHGHQAAASQQILHRYGFDRPFGQGQQIQAEAAPHRKGIAHRIGRGSVTL